MINFLNDYNDKGHEQVYDYLGKLPLDKISGYSMDDYSFSVREKIKAEIGRDDVNIEFFPGGTIVNIVACTHSLKSYEAIICPDTSHIAIHETASIEATGHKVVTIPTTDGKLRPEALAKELSLFGPETDVIPKLVYISNTSETGLVYSLDEIKALYEVAKDNDCYLYVDGARLAVAMAQGKFSLMDLSQACDIFTIGGTKNGALFGEVLIVVNDNLKVRLRNQMKQKGAIMAKGFILAAQFDALFADGLYYELGKHTYEKAMKLREGLEKLGVDFTYPPVSNQLFLKLSPELIEKVQKFALIGLENLGGHFTSVRLCTSYRTTDEEIEEFLEKFKELL
ncbi:MAG: aminotransferase class V-fold PLP-dependent enzyme [Bacillota bacterium]|nr:aminotransferase class V-fold PLP-dependent enzyme [Bacillota bacterium]